MVPPHDHHHQQEQPEHQELLTASSRTAADTRNCPPPASAQRYHDEGPFALYCSYYADGHNDDEDTSHHYRYYHQGRAEGWTPRGQQGGEQHEDGLLLLPGGGSTADADQLVSTTGARRTSKRNQMSQPQKNYNRHHQQLNKMLTINEKTRSSTILDRQQGQEKYDCIVGRAFYRDFSGVHPSHAEVNRYKNNKIAILENMKYPGGNNVYDSSGGDRSVTIKEASGSVLVPREGEESEQEEEPFQQNSLPDFSPIANKRDSISEHH